jgi:uncharacterized UPF0160 family protein
MYTDFYLCDNQVVLLDCFVQRIDRIVTHDGVFYADSVFATALLKYFMYPDIEIVRTRDSVIIDSVIIATAMDSRTTLLIGVGGIYDPKRLAFDHRCGYIARRPSFDLDDAVGRIEDGKAIPYSSFGLIWRHFGRMLSSGDEYCFNRFDDLLVKGIDAISCGYKIHKLIPTMSVSQVIALYNPTSVELDEGTRMVPDAFDEAVKVASAIIARTMQSIRAEAKAKAIKSGDPFKQ